MVRSILNLMLETSQIGPRHYNGWYDGHQYNISFYAILTEDGEPSGNDRFFEIEFFDTVDVAILSNPTDQNRLQRVKQDLESMGMTYIN